MVPKGTSDGNRNKDPKDPLNVQSFHMTRYPNAGVRKGDEWGKWHQRGLSEGKRILRFAMKTKEQSRRDSGLG